MTVLRTELLRFEQPDGGLELLDLVLEQLHTFTPEEAVALRALETQGTAPPAPLEQRLRRWFLYEGPDAEALREGCKFSRQRSRMPAPEVGAAQGAFELASSLPDWVSSTWREPERWRRLAEDRIAGRVLLRLEGFLNASHARSLRDEAASMSFERLDSMYAQGGCHNIQDDETLAWLLSAFRQGPLCTLLGCVLGEALPKRIFARVWELVSGDGMGVHNDGIHYVGTFSLGLSENWSARNGGGIAFGVPSASGLEITERWIPHLGDLLLFRPTSMAWHAVETVTEGTRYTLTGHYVSPAYGT